MGMRNIQNSVFVLLSCILLSSTAAFAGQKSTKIKYPVVEELWKKGAVTEENLGLPDLPETLPPAVLAQHKVLYGQLQDPALRIRHIKELGKSTSKETFLLLVSLLSREKEPFCRSALFSTLALLAEKGCADPVSAEKLILCTKENRESRKHAAMIYFNAAVSPDPEKVLAAMEGKNDEYLMRELFPFFARYAEKISPERVAQWCKSPAGSSFRSWGYALAYLRCKENTAGKDKELILNGIAEDSPEMVRYYLAKSAAYKKGLWPEIQEFLRRESEKGFLLVYLKELEKIPSLTEETESFVKSFLDKKYLPSIRIAAAEVLKNGRENILAETLVPLLAEEDPVLRKAICRALKKMKLSAFLRKKIAEIGKKYMYARLETAEIFAEIKDRNYDDLLILFLEEAGGKEKQSSREIALQEICLKYLGEVKVVKALPAICRKSGSRIERVRNHVAFALGRIASAKTFPVLQKLIRDASFVVSEGGMKAVLFMALEKKFSADELKKSFADEVIWILKKRQSEFAGARAAAAGCAALLDLVGRCRNDLKTLIMKECIKIPASPDTFDLEHVRISCLLALLEESRKKGGRITKEEFLQILSDLQVAAENKETGGSESWKEYLRQIVLMQKGEKIIPAFVSIPRPNMDIAPLVQE